MGGKHHLNGARFITALFCEHLHQADHAVRGVAGARHVLHAKRIGLPLIFPAVMGKQRPGADPPQTLHQSRIVPVVGGAGVGGSPGDQSGGNNALGRPFRSVAGIDMTDLVP